MIEFEENTEDHHAIIEQVLKESPPGEILLPSQDEGAKEASAPIPASMAPKYTKEQKQKLFIKQLFRLSKQHIDYSKDVEGVSIVGTEVGTISSGPPMPGGSAPVASASPSGTKMLKKPKKTVSAKDFFLCLTECSAFDPNCGGGQRTGSLSAQDDPIEGAGTYNDEDSVNARTDASLELNVATAGSKTDEQISEDSPGVVNVPITMGDADPAGQTDNGDSTIEDACASTISTRNSLRDIE